MTVQAGTRQSQDVRVVIRYGGALFAYGMAVLLALAASTRWLGWGRDFFEYQSYYNAIPARFSLRDTRFEPSFHLLAWSFKNILGLPYAALIFSIVLTSLTIKFHLFRRHLQLWWAAIVVYFCIFYPNHEYTQIRVAISLAFVFLAVHMALDRRYAWGVVFGLVGVSFHYSAVLPLIFFALGRLVTSRVALWCFCIAAIVFGLFWKELDRLALELISHANPLIGAYALNIRNLEARPFSVNNLIFFAVLISAVMLGWLNREIYQYVFTIMSIGAASMLFIFIAAPELAQRTKEVLFPSIIFCIFRPKMTARTVIPMALLAADAGLLLYLAFRERVLGG